MKEKPRKAALPKNSKSFPPFETVDPAVKPWDDEDPYKSRHPLPVTRYSSLHKEISINFS